MAPLPERLRILFLAPSSPLPATRGGNQRTNLILQVLQSLGRVDFVYIHGDLEPVPAELERSLRAKFGLEMVVRPRGGPEGRWTRRVLWKGRGLVRVAAAHLGLPGFGLSRDPEISRRVGRLLDGRHYDLVVVRYLRAAKAAEPFGRAPVILDADDFEISHLEAMLGEPGLGRIRRGLTRTTLAMVKKPVSEVLARCTHVWATSEDDRTRIGAWRSSVLPNIPFDPPDGPIRRAPDLPVIVLVASLRYEVNRAAVSYFLREIWPRIHRARLDSRVRIVGAGMPDGLRSAWRQIPGVEVLGFVEDLTGIYDRCLFTVAPIFHGGGTKIKVLESLAYRRACVTTRHVHRGFEEALDPDVALTVAESPDDFVAGCIRLLDEPDAARAMADVGYEIVRKEYSFARFRHIIDRTVHQAVRPAPL